MCILGHCPKNERYQENAPEYEITCQNTYLPVINGCVCKEGYYRDEISHACVPRCPLPGL